MTNIKKIGLTALAASLVSTSAFAGAVTITGGASITTGQYDAPNALSPHSWSMGDNLIFSGGGTLDNGLTVALSMEIDESIGSTFEAQSITLSSDAMGSLAFNGIDGLSASGSINKTAAGNIWDSFDGTLAGTGVTGTDRLGAGASTNSFIYTTPALAEGLNLFASYNPTQAAAAGGKATYLGYGVTYTGVAGLTAKAAHNDIEGTAANLSGDHDVMYLSYAFGAFTGSVSNSDFKIGTGLAATPITSTTADAGQEARSYNISYTISENLSVAYGTEKLESNLGTDSDAEFTNLSGSYTAGGMTLSAGLKDGENIAYATAEAEDQEYWYLSASFAF